jgi:hypothetical protein
MTREAKAGTSKGNGKTASNAAASLRGVPYNRPDTGLDDLARKGADARRVSLRRLEIDSIGTEGQVGRHDGGGCGRD